ncbi:MAG TPA: DUF1553 domain-containing protein [Planctomycetaceae bacterium]|nr:DUF1553 domain-containing protein [Planctomycetaceae bacterium]
MNNLVQRFSWILPCVTIAITMCVCTVGAANETASRLDFTNDVAPILTKLGCNAGGCHGKSTGRGGFKLSLFGFNAHEDFDSVSRASRGRRIFPASPDDSLLLKKATMTVPHGGGRRLDRSDPEYRLLRDWIAANMPWGTGAARIEQLQIAPAERQMKRAEKLQLTATAIYSDGSHRDVTRLVRFSSGNPAVAEVGANGLVQTKNRTGETTIVGLYQGRTAVSRVITPAANATAEVERRLAEFDVANLIDRHVIEKLKLLRVPPAAIVDDGTFLRRSTVQIAGRLPTLMETQAFLDDQSSNKREQLIERLLASEEYADQFAQKWSDLLRNKRRGQKPRIPGTIAFHRWIRNAIAANMPYDQFVREIITATGNVTVNPPAQWYAEVRYLDRYVDDTAQVFLGIRIGCARCHHHPFEKFSQDDYYGMAAFFARIDRKGGAGVAERRADETVFIKAAGEVLHPLTGKVVSPRGLDGEELEIAPYEDPRQALVDWMQEPDNPYFARAFVNRMWAHFFGRGLVEPMDDLRATNPATIEPLLDELAAEFINSKFDMKHVIRLICTSNTYQLSSQAQDEDLDETENHSRFYPQRMPAEVLLDALDQTSAVVTRYKGLPVKTRAIQLPDEDYSNEFLRLFGRPKRESACECERTSQPSLAQSIFVMNNRFILDKTTSKDNYAAALAADQRSDPEKLGELFLTAFSREPTPLEMRNAIEYLASETDKRKAYGNLLWALMNTKEFMYIH